MLLYVEWAVPELVERSLLNGFKMNARFQFCPVRIMNFLHMLVKTRWLLDRLILEIRKRPCMR